MNKMGMRQRQIMIIPLGGFSAVTILKYKASAYTYKFKLRLFGTIQYSNTQKGFRWNTTVMTYMPQKLSYCLM